MSGQPADMTDPRAVLVGAAWLALGVTCFAVIDAIAKYLSDDYGTVQITWARYAFFVLPLAMFTPLRIWRETAQGPRLGLKLLRASMPTFATIFAVISLSTVPLDLFTAISFAAPLIVTALSGPFLGEHPGWRRWSAVIVGFCGVLVIARPWDESFGIGVVFAVGLTMFFAFYQLLNRKLAGDGTPRAMLLQVALIGFVVTMIALPFDWTTPDAEGWALMVCSGLVHTASHFSIIRAFNYAPASTLAPFIYVQIVSAVALGYFMFGDLPDWTTIGGVAVVIGCGIYIVQLERRRR